MTAEHFVKVNGFSNLFWGWGGEDDDMASRIRYHKLIISRYPPSVARYTMLAHKKARPNPNRYRVMRNGAKRSRVDGLSNLKYKRLDIQLKTLYTHILVDIQPWNSLPTYLKSNATVLKSLFSCCPSLNISDSDSCAESWPTLEHSFFPQSQLLSSYLYIFLYYDFNLKLSSRKKIVEISFLAFFISSFFFNCLEHSFLNQPTYPHQNLFFLSFFLFCCAVRE